jgi:transcriptional regulator with XRE-family HTH domain
MDTLSEIFRARRLALGLTQAQAAAAAGLGTRTLVAFENGQGRISLANLRRAMAIVGLELTAREASRRPTLDELSERYTGEEPEPKRKRAPRQSIKPS